MLQPIEESVSLRTCPVSLRQRDGSSQYYQLVEMDGDKHSQWLSLFADATQAMVTQQEGDDPKIDVKVDQSSVTRMSAIYVKTIAMCLQKVVAQDGPSISGLWATSLENYRKGGSAQGVQDGTQEWLADGLEPGEYESVEVIKRWPNSRIEQLYQMSREVSGLNDEAEDEAKNSSKGEKEDGSDSPANSASPSNTANVHTPIATS